MRLVQEHDRPAYMIVDRMRNLMIERRDLYNNIKGVEDNLRDLNSKANALDNEKRLLETNLSRALIQEIEGEERATI